jgi:hypothetical protein
MGKEGWTMPGRAAPKTLCMAQILRGANKKRYGLLKTENHVIDIQRFGPQSVLSIILATCSLGSYIRISRRSKPSMLARVTERCQLLLCYFLTYV